MIAAANTLSRPRRRRPGHVLDWTGATASAVARPTPAFPARSTAVACVTPLPPGTRNST